MKTKVYKLICKHKGAVCIVLAKTELQARMLARNSAGSEGKAAWIDPEKCLCLEIQTEKGRLLWCAGGD